MFFGNVLFFHFFGLQNASTMTTTMRNPIRTNAHPTRLSMLTCHESTPPPPFNQTPVTTFTRGADALTALRERRRDFDIVLSDVHMPDMDGFKLLEHIALELDVPVMMMSANCATDVVLRGIIHGAVDYLLKPVRIEELRNIWQHVVRKRREDSGGEHGAGGSGFGSGDPTEGVSDEGSEGSRDPHGSGGKKGNSKRDRVGAGGSPSKKHASDEDDLVRAKKPLKRDRDVLDAPGGADNGLDGGKNGFTGNGSGNGRNNGNGNGNESLENDAGALDDEGNEDSSALKKPRVVWSAELHQQFVTAVNTLGIDKAVPKRILDLMGVQGLTRENVASHLQKYRLYLKRLQGVGNGNGNGGNGGSPGFMTGLAGSGLVDATGGMVAMGGPGGRVGSPNLGMNGNGNGGMDGRVMGNGMAGDGVANGGHVHHLPNGVQMGNMMYQMNHNGMIPIPGVRSGPGGSIHLEKDSDLRLGGHDGRSGGMHGGGGPYPTMLPPMMMNGGGGGGGVQLNGGMHGVNGGGMHGIPHGAQMHGGMHHVGSAGQMHAGGMVMGALSGGNNGGYPHAFNGNGVMYASGGNGMLMNNGGDGGDLGFDKKNQGSGGIGDLGDDAVLDMFLKDGLPEDGDEGGF